MQPLKADSPILATVEGIVVLLHPNTKVLLCVSIIALQLSRESYVELPSATEMDVRPVQPEKAEFPMLVTPFGIIMEARL